MIETDGPYEGAKCSSTEHAHHQGEDDSVWTHYERNMESSGARPVACTST